MSERKKKFRTEFRKNRTGKKRDNDLTRRFSDSATARDAHHEHDALARDERISGKGEISRKRTIIGQTQDDASDLAAMPGVGNNTTLRGRVLCVYGLTSDVEGPDGAIISCATRRLLKTLATEQRHVVAAGDWVRYRPSGDSVSGNAPREGIIEQVEPRRGILARNSRGRQHIMVANVDQLLVLGSAAEPYLKPNLIDRFLVSAEQVGLRPIIGINKIDLTDPAELQPLVGVYARMGYPVILLSATEQRGVAQVRQLMANRSTVIVGQSGVGKSSLLNALEPDWQLRTSAVSTDNQKGRHTTTTAKLMKLSFGGYVVDTPGIRQFQLWDIIAEEVAQRFRDLRPFANQCHFPNCTHTHESGCAIKDGVADGYLDARRYESYCAMREDDDEADEEWE